MKYLFIDDMPEYLKLHERTLKKAGHIVETAHDIGIGWASIKRAETAHPFDLILIDLALDRKIREFDGEYEKMKESLDLHGYGDLPISGQALGLRLWRLRKNLRQRYCYLSNHPHLWLDNLNERDPEFGGETLKNLSELVLDKSDLWSRNIGEKLKSAYQTWEDRQWIG